MHVRQHPRFAEVPSHLAPTQNSDSPRSSTLTRGTGGKERSRIQLGAAFGWPQSYGSPRHRPVDGSAASRVQTPHWQLEPQKPMAVHTSVGVSPAAIARLMTSHTPEPSRIQPQTELIGGGKTLHARLQPWPSTALTTVVHAEQ